MPFVQISIVAPIDGISSTDVEDLGAVVWSNRIAHGANAVRIHANWRWIFHSGMAWMGF